MLSLVQIYYSLIGYQYLVLFSLVAIEGPIISVAAGFLVAQGLMNIYLAFFIIIIADLIGDALYYALGRWGANFGMKIFRISQERLTQLEKYFISHGGKTLLWGKLAHGIGTSFLFAAGAAKMPFRKFLYFNFIATIPKSIILLFIGYLFGQSFARIGKYFDYYAVFTLSLGIILITIYLMLAKKFRKKEEL